MNGKKAKALRRMSEKATVGLPYRRFKPRHSRRILVTCTRLVCNRLKKRLKRGDTLAELEEWIEGFRMIPVKQHE